MERIYLNEDWKFAEQFSEEMITQGDTRAGFTGVRLPHTIKELPFHYFDEKEYQMVSAYVRHLRIPTDWKGKRIFLTMEGVAHIAEVYVNGEKRKEHRCGYTAFTTELTEAVKYGEENLLVVKVDSREEQKIPPFGFAVDDMTYGGIYRDVYLEVKEPAYLEDVFVTTELPKDLNRRQAKVISKIRVSTRERLAVRQYLVWGEHKKRIAREQEICGGLTITAGVSQIKLWDIESPELYELVTELVKDGMVVDTKCVRFGFRRAQFQSDGFYLNDRKVKLRGLNRHQSYPYVGYAMPESMQKLDADILKKELGCNAVRTSHYPQSHYFIDRCDELGLLVFMEFPCWQHSGDARWKEQVLVNEREMILQYRNHTSIILWGIGIHESQDDECYAKMNALAHQLDSTRPARRVRAHKKSHLYPTKAFDWEEHRVEHALRHASVLDEAAAQMDISGSFGWCMFDYNTHKEFGSGDRICYHGVLDMFRNPKPAAFIYACEQEEEPILEVSSSMDMGEHPGGCRGITYIFSNADSVRMYKNGEFMKAYTKKDSPYRNLKHGPMVIDDFIGDQMEKNENFVKDQAAMLKEMLNYMAIHGYDSYPPKMMAIAAKCMTIYGMKPTDIRRLYNKYIGNWGGASTVYRFDAIQDGEVVKSITKEPMKKMHFSVQVSSSRLKEHTSYDVAEIRITARDENGNQMYFYNDPIQVKTEGAIEQIGPDIVPLRGGMTGIYVKSIGENGLGMVTLSNAQLGEIQIPFQVEGRLYKQ